MENLKMLPATDNNTLKQCLQIRNAAFTLEKGVPKSIEIDEYDCLNDQCTHFLIQFKNENAGTIRCLKVSDTVIRIQRFCFYKHFRKDGLGKAVMEYIEKKYREKGIIKIVMDAKFEVCGFYEKCGYRKMSDLFIEAGIEHVKMEKNFI
ncbi:MAG: GNAT family N-acetyltransferase [Oscillospiraceae bacterium]|nr:GNAT family N-acetyltransferase [Oscillospiraceae bacterium]MDD3261653.1 GNAT family N-acetyltransferase [Oscillospiraceae bacterium]